MITCEKIREIAQGLIDKSKANQVGWTQMGVFQDTKESSIFEVALPTSSITIGFGSPETDPDYYVMFLNSRNSIIGSLRTTDESSSDWRLLKALHEEAKRVVSGWDGAIDEIEAALKNDKPIGVPQPNSGN